MQKMQQQNLEKLFEKVIVNIGVGRMRQQSQFEEKIMPEIMQELAMITGQKPSPRPTKKAIAGFKTRTGDIVGLKVTMRRKRMADFIKKIIFIVLPRVRDFRGIPLKNIDSGGNLNIGLKEQYVFSEISPEKSKVNFGLEITIVPKIKTKEKAVELYKSAGFPLQ
ncbi:MAG: 50S ribosomal protein L5 [Patescibacteria group bacterium]